MNTWRLRNPAINSLLVIASIAGSLLCAELALRIFVPLRYDDVGTVKYVPDATKIWAPARNATTWSKHPDTLKSIPIVRNNLGIPTGRDLSGPELSATENIAVFGASYAANTGLPAPHTFPEVLKSLVNAGTRRFEVLNFGVANYGPDQSYLLYRELDIDIRKELDHVIYLLARADFSRAAVRGFMSLDESGKVVLTPRGPRIPKLAGAIRKLHITYFLLDLHSRIRDIWEGPEEVGMVPAESRKKQKPGQAQDPDYRAKLMNALMLQWQADIESWGGKFHIAIVPDDSHASMAAVLDQRLHRIDLHPYFSRAIPGFRFSDIRFKNDYHWNEAGNLLAGAALYAELAPALGMPALADSELVSLLRRHYQSVADGWQPAQIGRIHFHSQPAFAP